MPGIVTSERINRAVPGREGPFANYNQFRIEHTGVIREIRLWMQGLGITDNISYTFIVNDVDQLPMPDQWFHPIENGVAYIKTGLNIPVTKGMKANFHQLGKRLTPPGITLDPLLPIFIYETEIP